jgi:hypothetical protein
MIDTTQLGEPLFEIKNNWRQRQVKVYKHPFDDSLLVTAGHPFAGGEPVVCEEAKDLYKHNLKVAEERKQEGKPIPHFQYD